MAAARAATYTITRAPVAPPATFLLLAALVATAASPSPPAPPLPEATPLPSSPLLAAVAPPALLDVPVSSSPSTTTATRMPGTNATVVLQQARAGLSTALREVRLCRAARAQCQEELVTCKAVPKQEEATSERSTEADAALQQARTELQARTAHPKPAYNSYGHVHVSMPMSMPMPMSMSMPMSISTSISTSMPMSMRT